MANLTEQLKHGVGNALASIAEGWRELRARANGALTQFRPKVAEGESTSSGVPFLSTWAFLAADVVDSKNEVVVRVEAPGISRSDFKLELLGDVLCVRGEKRVDKESDFDGLHVIQCAYGSFRRNVLLPCEVTADNATATYRDGVLRIVLPKVASAEPQRISVKVS